VLDWFSVNLSNFLQMVVMATTVIAVFFGMKSEVKVIRHDVHNIEKQLEHLSESLNRLGTILTQLAVQDARISMIERSIEDFRHGKGFVK
jgi:hypothetical protein